MIKSYIKIYKKWFLLLIAILLLFAFAKLAELHFFESRSFLIMWKYFAIEFADQRSAGYWVSFPTFESNDVVSTRLGGFIILLIFGEEAVNSTRSTIIFDGLMHKAQDAKTKTQDAQKQ
jgi:hypothetical protein